MNANYFYLEINISAIMSVKPPYVTFANAFPDEDQNTLCNNPHSLKKSNGENRMERKTKNENFKIEFRTFLLFNSPR